MHSKHWIILDENIRSFELRRTTIPERHRINVGNITRDAVSNFLSRNGGDTLINSRERNLTRNRIYLRKSTRNGRVTWPNGFSHP